MTIPVYKIETYTVAVKDYTIEKDCVAYRVKTALTGQLGNFSFTLPGMRGLTQCYDDIAVWDKVKIYLDYDSVGATPLFVGRIENIQNRWISGPPPQYVRIFSGRDQGEVTARLIRDQWSSGGGTAHDVVDKWCDDCGLGKTEVAADATAVDVVSHQSKYAPLLRDICDYATSIDKDWYVDVDNNLVWKVRPIRDTGISTLTVGENVKSYNLTRNLREVYNKFYVFGASEPTVDDTAVCDHGLDCSPTDLPANHEDWDETLNDWTCDSKSGTDSLILGAAAPHCGDKYVIVSVAWGDSVADEWVWQQRAFNVLRVKDSARLDWYYRFVSPGNTLQSAYVMLLAPDTSNYFIYHIDSSNFPAENTGTHFYAMCGPAYEAIAGNEKWQRVGDPDWYNLQGIRFYSLVDTDASEGLQQFIDCLYFSSLRWHDLDEDGGSQTSYGVRPMLVVDDRIHSNTHASNYAAVLKDRHKDVPLQLDVVMPLDTNLLIGDRIPITIAKENLSAQDFDVIIVEHLMTKELGTLTRGTLVSKARMRTALKTTDSNVILRDMKTRTEDLITNRTVIK